jgi:shikimate kinase / 3-dehydroquinate synthase
MNPVMPYPAPRVLSINAPGLQHQILLGHGLLGVLPAILDANHLAGPILLVTDEPVVSSGCLDDLLGTPAAGHWPRVTLPGGERYKTLDTVRRLYDDFLRHGLDRSGLVIAAGGGVIGDTAGFAAATFMRGVRWVNVPTTLLAMVDASLGGKTGVDLPQGKNLVGAFYPPALVVSDLAALRTLPHAEHVSAMAEIIAHGMIGDAALFETIERAGEAAHRLDLQIDQLQQAIEVKIRVVEADPFEKGERAKLNLGHTIGHGVEAASDYRLRHGEAVAIGLVAESQLSERMGLADGGLAARIRRVVTRAGLPAGCPGVDPERIRRAMSSDKKKAGGRLKFALPRHIGDVIWGVEVDETLLMEVLEALSQDTQTVN